MTGFEVNVYNRTLSTNFLMPYDSRPLNEEQSLVETVSNGWNVSATGAVSYPTGASMTLGFGSAASRTNLLQNHLQRPYCGQYRRTCEMGGRAAQDQHLNYLRNPFIADKDFVSEEARTYGVRDVVAEARGYKKKAFCRTWRVGEAGGKAVLKVKVRLHLLQFGTKEYSVTIEQHFKIEVNIAGDSPAQPSLSQHCDATWHKDLVSVQDFKNSSDPIIKHLRGKYSRDWENFPRPEAKDATPPPPVFLSHKHS